MDVGSIIPVQVISVQAVISKIELLERYESTSMQSKGVFVTDIYLLTKYSMKKQNQKTDFQ